LENEIYKFAVALRGDLSLRAAKAQLKAFAPDDKIFEADFSSVSLNRSATQRYLLRKIENASRRTGELSLNSPQKVHVEHIYPQRPLEGGRLPNHEEMINRLGNLTLLDKKFNQTIRNTGIEVKAPYFAESDIMITKMLKDETTWTAEKIGTRQAMLASRAVKVWSLD
jgi:hypothetical protein